MDLFLTTGLVGRLAWLVGNGVEAHRRTIERWAANPPTSVFEPGWPPFFYALVAPPTVAASVGTCVRHRGDPVVGTSALATALAVAISAVLVRTVVLPLRGAAPEGDRLVARWFVLNRARMAAVGVAVVADLCVLARR
ncbi:hypothetical protein [Actinomycetospora termitidis]|uniref:DUF1772 domain-containing protein n=1 Tax=Actinomycetospora termitidis TaxID=3053470 RepID=A0ABT7MBM3_9PSEU|nr:hypothetical protein [Actinomycetospora sp. Odt1-22]MDL5158065.1 hypothetical protein [Actinomycetospora sp. Odt1-22]